MAAGIGDLWVVCSGGALDDNLGGAISTGPTRVVSQTATRAVTNITGTTILDSYGNPEGTGSLYYNDTNVTLGWRPYGQVNYYGVGVSVAGTYLIGSSSGYMLVSVTSIPSGTDLFDNVSIANNQNNVFGSVAAADSLNGITEYRCLYVLNNHATDPAANVKLWILSNTPAGDDIYIGLEDAGAKNQAAGTTTGTSTPTNAVTFSQPASQGAGLSLGTLNAGDYFAFWQKRVVPPETRGTVISNGCALAISMDV